MSIWEDISAVGLLVAFVGLMWLIFIQWICDVKNKKKSDITLFIFVGIAVLSITLYAISSGYEQIIRGWL